MTLTDLIEKGGHADLLRDMIGFRCERMMELDVDEGSGSGSKDRG